MFATGTLKYGAPALLAAALATASCGTTPGERALSGGLIGAGTGAAIGSLSAKAGAGALIGGAAGAVIGAVTAPTPSRNAYSGRCLRYSSRTGNCLRRG